MFYFWNAFLKLVRKQAVAKTTFQTFSALRMFFVFLLVLLRNGFSAMIKNALIQHDMFYLKDLRPISAKLFRVSPDIIRNTVVEVFHTIVRVLSGHLMKSNAGGAYSKSKECFPSLTSCRAYLCDR